MGETSRSQTVSTRLQRIAKLAADGPSMVFTTLAHHLDEELLRRAFQRTRKDAAPGIDGQNATEYAGRLEENLRSLVDRARSGRYFAPPVRRVHIPKGDGSETRPIGIPTFEDRVLQRGVAMIMEAVYEQDFLDCSYGFRPKRSAHGALDKLWHTSMRLGGGWVLEVDIRKFFDTLDHERLREILRLRVRDGALLRLIGKWLNAGVLEDGRLSHPTAGTPQGGVISPLLANIYLHEVLDTWFENVVKPRLRGEAVLIRYADDVVVVFAEEHDARRVQDVLPKRFAKYGLTLHPDKTKLVDFRRPRRTGKADPLPPSFDLLGFTHFWSRSKKSRWVVKRKTAKGRLKRALMVVGAWCRRFRHMPLAEQHRCLVRKLQGHYGYYGITGNAKALGCFRYGVICSWVRWLRRRSQRISKDRKWVEKLLRRFRIPSPRVVHSVYRAAIA